MTLGKAAVAVKSNEHNMTETLEWIRSIQIHQDHLQKMQIHLQSGYQPMASMDKRGAIRFKSLDQKRAYINKKRIDTQKIYENRKNREIQRENSKINKALNAISSRKLSQYGGLVKQEGRNIQPFSTKILLNDESGPEFDALKNFNLTEEQKMELL